MVVSLFLGSLLQPCVTCLVLCHYQAVFVTMNLRADTMILLAFLLLTKIALAARGLVLLHTF